jgi:hypothetical protein
MARMHALALTAVTALLLAGCGGSASPPPAYVTAGDADCATQLAALHGLARPTTPGQVVAYVPRALDIIERGRSELAALDPPAGARAELARALASQDHLAALLHHVLGELESGLVEPGMFSRAASEASALKADIDAHLRRAGLARCA